VLVLSHLHDDHTNGVRRLMDRLPVSWLILPADYDDEDRMLGEVTEAAAAHGVTVLFLEEETDIKAGDVDLSLLLPRAGSDENDRGIVTFARLGQTEILFMGDAGEAAELALLDRGLVPDADVLVVGHHGSAGSSGLLFLRACSPGIAVISVGAGNAYGHPARETLDRLYGCGASVLRTDENETITIRQTMGDAVYG